MKMRRIFLKLGGSLITDKHRPSTAKPEIIERLADEILYAIRSDDKVQLIIGHGSGSFGHIPAKQYQTRQGVHTPEEWQGFLEVYRQARKLNQIVYDIFSQKGLPVIAFPPSAMILANNKHLSKWNPKPLVAALQAGFIPLVNGDVVFDTKIGGTIFSTEDVFATLAATLPPTEILLCGIENGVFADFPVCSQLLPKITATEKARILPLLQGSAAPDVTGGMVEKVRLMFELIETYPLLRAMIFSGLYPGNLQNALSGIPAGTLLTKE
ncbi:MAG: uridylate kinase [Bellilinea sp.]|nr:MAG: uridylate kinase [Bellilinea sp.]